MQTDLFSNDETNVRSFPPHLDPSRAYMVLTTEEEDKDHVADPVNGALPIGALGSNRRLWVVRVYDNSDKVLFAESFTQQGAAQTCSDGIKKAISKNRQQSFL